MKYFITENINNLVMNLSEEEYKEKIKELIEILKNDVTVRTKKCKIQFTDKINKEINFGNYLSYVIIYEIYNKFKTPITKDEIINIKDLNTVEKYFDDVIEKFFINYKTDDNDIIDNNGYNEVGSMLVSIIDNLNEVSCIITEKFGPTFNLYDFIELAKRNKEFSDIMYHPQIDENETINIKNLIKHTNDTTNRIEEIICEDEDNTFKYFLKSKSGVNMKQLGQIFGYIGLKPDLKEKIIPKPINTNFAVGLQNVTDYYINAIGCLKALITTHIQVKNSGYFTRKLLVLLADEFINEEYDCGTKHLMPFNVKNENQLKHLNLRWFSMFPDGRKLEKIDLSKKDYSNLVGKVIFLRDPITCACEHGICKKCYGGLWKVNYKMAVGIIAALLLTNNFTQTMLSTKHMLQAILKKYEYSEGFKKYFEFDLDKIVLKEDYSDVTIEIENIDSNEEKEKEYLVYRFVVIDGNERTTIEEEMPFILNDELSDNIKSYFNKDTDSYIIKPKVLNDYEYIFSQNIDNNGASRTMLLVKDLIDKKYYIDNHDLFELYERFIDLIGETNASIDYVHISVIIKNMIKVILGRKEFKESEEFPNTKLYIVSDAVHYLSESVSKPLLFEHIKKHFTTDIYDSLDKEGTSSYDELLK